MKGKILFGVLFALLAVIAIASTASENSYSVYLTATGNQNSTFGIYEKYNTSQKIDFSTLDNENTITLPEGYVPIAFGIGNLYNKDEKTTYKMNLIQLYVKGAKLNDNGTIDYDDTVEVFNGDMKDINKIVELPEDYVVVGFGVSAKRVNPGKNMNYKYLEVYARKLYPAYNSPSDGIGLSSKLYTFTNGTYSKLEGKVLLSSEYIGRQFGGRAGGYYEARPSKLEISGQKLILNTLPFITNIDYYGEYETDNFIIDIDAYDLDGDYLTYSCGEPFGEDCEWLTEVGDAGEYEVEVTVSDGHSQVTGTITVLVKEKTTEQENRAPIIISVSLKSDISEGDLVKLNVTAYDPDGDEITITCTEPFDDDCEWQTAVGDAGLYWVNVTVSDGELSDSMTINFNVNEKDDDNHAPVIDDVYYFGEYEGEEFVIIVNASDEDGDSLTITCEAPFDNDYCVWQTEVGDAGEYEVEVTVSDGVLEVTETITVLVMEEGEDDTTEPVITVYEPVSDAVYNITTLLLEVSADEPIASWWYVLDDGDEVEFTPNTTIGGLDDGEHTITIYAEDLSGNIGEETVEFTIDTQGTPTDYKAPICSIDYLENKITNNKYYLTTALNYFSETGNFYIIGEAIDDISSIIKAQYNRTSPNDYWLWDDAAASDGAFNERVEGWKTDFNDNEFIEGTHQVCCRAVDSNNNGNNGDGTCKSFCIDTQKPKIVDIHLTNPSTCNAFAVEQAPEFSWEAVDDYGCAGINHYEVEVYDTQGLVYGMETFGLSHNVNSAINGSAYYIKVRAVDNAGNKASWVTSNQILYQEGICEPPQLPQCSDGIDNDGDGKTDYPQDFSCTSALDNDETNPKAQCQDGIDNDGDGKTDYPQDSGCSSYQDNSERTSSNGGDVGVGDIIEISTCTERWVCDDWSVCNSGGQFRHCTEVNNCGTDKLRPEEVKQCSSTIYLSGDYATAGSGYSDNKTILRNSPEGSDYGLIGSALSNTFVLVLLILILGLIILIIIVSLR